MKQIDGFSHVQGKSQFVDDAPLPEGLLFAAVLPSPVAHGKITRLDTGPPKKIKGVEGIFTADDIPGENQIGKMILDEPLLAEDHVHYMGQPIAFAVSKSTRISRAAIQAIEVEFENLPPIFDSRKAYAQGQLIVPSRTFSLGDVDRAWQDCDLIVEGQADSGGQEHIYLETQGAFACPTENGGVKVVSATQSPSLVQMMIARILGIAMHNIEVDVMRLGGAFGGKEHQATPWAAMTALAAYRLKRPVKLVLRRQEDIRMTGKRHPYSSDFKIGLTREGKILAYQATFYQNAGAAADLSPAILERSLFHATNTYFIPNVHVTAVSCQTNLPPNTACRGFGGPQAMFVMEAAIFKAAQKMGIEPWVIQKKNLLKEGDRFPYGMRVENSQARRCWQCAEQKCEIENIRQKIREFNSENQLQKKGLSFMPICFGISFTSTFLNQAGALVHVYTDGSVSVSTGAVEMGQGVKTKIQQVVARIFSIHPHRIKVESTNTTRIANMSPAAASTGADMNGKATKLACLNILNRLKEVAAKKLDAYEPEDIEIRDETVYMAGRKTDLEWRALIGLAYFNRINLSAQAHYATPGIYFDREKEKGRPFAYHVFGTAVTEVTVDCLRGTYQNDAVKVVHDFGQSLNPLIDRGQVEGGVVQGIGWMTIEELIYAENGRLLTDTLTTYKVPDIYFAPRNLEVYFLENSENPRGIFNSKAIGEPPFMYGIGSYFAILAAMKAFRPDLKIKLSAPITPEKVLLALYEGTAQTL